MQDAFQPGSRRRLPDHFVVPRGAALESRKHPGYCEIYLRVPMVELRRRDAKGIYAAATEANYATSLASMCRRSCPEAADLTLDNFGTLDSSAAVDRIWTECVIRDGARMAGPAPPSRSAPKQRRLRPWRRSCAAARFSRKSASRLPNGVRIAPECSQKLRTRTGVPGRSSSAAARRERMAR